MATKEGTGAERSQWFDEKTHTPLIEKYARQLSSFMDTMADGKVVPAELKAQEKRLVDLMMEVEPLLDDALHAKVTHLLCELTAYDLMQTLYAMQGAKPKTKFRG